MAPVSNSNTNLHYLQATPSRTATRAADHSSQPDGPGDQSELSGLGCAASQEAGSTTPYLPGCDLFRDYADSDSHADSDSDDESCVDGVVLKVCHDVSASLGLAKCSGFEDFATTEVKTVANGHCGYDCIRFACLDYGLNFPGIVSFRKDLVILAKCLIEKGEVGKSIVMPGKHGPIQFHQFSSVPPIQFRAIGPMY